MKDFIRRRHLNFVIFSFAVMAMALYAYLTNPFVRFSLILDPYQTIELKNGAFSIDSDSSLIVTHDPFLTNIALAKQAWHIVTNKLSYQKKAPQASVDVIIAGIHDQRFDPHLPFLISGEHFSVLYPRSLGIFYHSLLDSRTALSVEDWHNRLHIYLKTTAYALQVFSKAHRLSTTIIPVGPRSVVLTNIYAYPSDTLYSLLYGLDVMMSTGSIQQQYPYQTELGFETPNQTQAAAQRLLESYHASLSEHLSTYQQQVQDPETGLVKKDLWLSGTKDNVRRSSSFYDNVILWKTLTLAQKYGLPFAGDQDLSHLKTRIVHRYFDQKEGCFQDDQLLSDRTFDYSSDWLIAYTTGMLSPQDSTERSFLQSCVKYIQRNALDKPFALQYQTERRTEELVPIVRWLAPDYGTTAIWSNWGMEYTKLLIALAAETKNKQYLDQAEEQLNAYAFNIKRYRGYPEVYNAQGDFYQQGLYRSVRQTGWVVSYEQARAMHDWWSEHWGET